MRNRESIVLLNIHADSWLRSGDRISEPGRAPMTWVRVAQLAAEATPAHTAEVLRRKCNAAR